MLWRGMGILNHKLFKMTITTEEALHQIKMMCQKLVGVAEDLQERANEELSEDEAGVNVQRLYELHSSLEELTQ